MAVLPVGFGSSGSTAYQIANSLRFDGSNDYLSRTFGTPTDNKKWTWSGWVKRSSLGAVYYTLFGHPTQADKVFFESDKLYFYVGTGAPYHIISSALYRDPTAHMHVVVVYDSANATQADRMQLWVNGERITSFSSSSLPSASYAGGNLNTAATHHIGRADTTNNFYFSGYLSDIYFIDGQALTPSSFGEADSNGVWVPKAYTGSYGNNGFHLDFSDGTSTTTLGYSAGEFSLNLRSSGTNIGTYTTGGGLAAAFDGNTNQASASSARVAAPAAGYNSAVLGKDWGAGVTKTITAFRVFAQNDGGFVGNTSATTQIKLQGSSDGTNWTDLMSPVTTTGATSEVVTVTSGITTTTAYRYHRINFNANGSDNYYVCELELYEAGTYGLNHWTLSGMTRAAGVNECWMVDTPTDNFAVLNPLDWYASGTWAIVDGNLKGSLSSSPANQQGVLGSMLVESAKVYMEFTSTYSGGASTAMGVLDASYQWNGQGNLQAYTRTVAWGLCFSNGNKYNNSSVAYGSAVTSTTGILMCAVDTASGKIWWGKDGTWFGSGDPAAGTNAAFTNLPTKVKVYVECGLNGESVTANFGQRDFTYTPPTGFLPLSTANLPAVAIPDPSLHFDIRTYGGSGQNDTPVGSGGLSLPISFQPDFAWIKNRTGANDHNLFDVVRGGNGTYLYELLSDATVAEDYNTGGNYGAITTFNSDGFSVASANSNWNQVNASSNSYVSWLWKAGGTGVTNTAGSITSTVSANTTAGFSIIKFSKANATNETVGHGLGVKPAFWFGKPINDGTANWSVWHKNLPAPTTDRLLLNLTNAKQTDATYWNSTEPTSSVITMGTAWNAYNWIIYAFAEIPGYSKAGSFTGNNNSDGVYIHLGFRARYFLVKCHNSTSPWYIYDSARSTYNVTKETLQAESSGSESTTLRDLDFTAFGVKMRTSNDPNGNGASNQYIYFAIAEHPNGSNVSPAPAR